VVGHSTASIRTRSPSDGQPLCGECVREREFIDQEVEMQEANDVDE